MLDSKIKESFNTSLVQCLHSKRHLELLDVVDNLRAQGLNDHVDLPQLIVCGDQSSGKSSVLAAISGVPFPKKDNLCTRFATEVILRRNDDIDSVQISASITTGGFRPSGHQAMASSFRHDLESMDELPEILEKAAIAMGVGTTGSAFSSNILRLEVRGPHMPQLTIVDLPGLIHSENKYQSGEDIELVTELVGHYMGQERSIILAVVSAKNDYANQIVLTKARKVDPEGRRTLGIITKPDTLYSGSASESSFLSLAKNQDVRFSLGWHVVRNQDSNEIVDGDRDQVEMSFFETTRWSGLAEPNRGISSLRHRLSEVLFEQITKELPAMISEILESIEDTQVELTRMGRSRTTDLEKRLFIMELAQNFSSRAHAACEALYDHPFFAAQGIANTHSRRLRAIVQNANMAFAERMLSLPQSAKPKSLPVSKVQKSSDVTDLVARAKELIITHRGKELPGTFNPLLIGPLFREMSQTWLPLARNHVEGMWMDARTTITAILGDVADVNVAEKCMDTIIGPKFENVRSVLMDRLDTYMHEYQRQPITYNHYLTENVQAARMRRRREEATAGCLKVLSQRHGSIDLQDIDSLVAAIIGDHIPGMDDLAAQELADYSQAYYKVALKRVIDEIAANVIEPVVFLQLPKLLDPSDILKMTPADIDTIAEEPDVRKLHRQILQSKLETLNRSSLLCKLYIENRAALPYQSAAQQSAEYTSSNDRTPSYDSDALDVDNQQKIVVAIPQDARKDDFFEILEAVAPEAPPDEPSAAPLEEDTWASLTTAKKSKKKAKKAAAFSCSEEPVEPFA